MSTETKQAAHTPGPFYVGDSYQSLMIFGADGFSVGDTRAFPGKIRFEEAMANALLFAASPALLAAAKRVLAFYDTALKDAAFPNDPGIEDLRAAIAQAEGSSL